MKEIHGLIFCFGFSFQGAVAANLDLSKRRAAAVVAILISQYHVTADRLQAFGAGPYAPVSTNTSEDGSSLNRRVELVAQ
jgi:outer membrane protein OmpA-like peptidoglycan-associated protein